MLTGRGVVDTRFNISKGLSGSQIVRPAGDEKPGITFVWPYLGIAGGHTMWVCQVGVASYKTLYSSIPGQGR